MKVRLTMISFFFPVATATTGTKLKAKAKTRV